jgi:hypothetical protein
MHYEIIKNNVRITLHTDTYEGWEGNYNPNNPDDDLLFRFDVDRFIDGEWQAVDDASYCTQLTADLPTEMVQKALSYLLNEIYEAASQGNSIKKTCERLSWIQADWLN